MIAVAAIFMSAKFQEIDPPKLRHLVLSTSSDYRRIISYEEKLLSSLDYQIHPPAEEIYKLFGVSKNKFKMAVGNLYKKKFITIEEGSIQLVRGPKKRGDVK